MGKQQQIIDEIKSLLSTVTRANNYKTDLGLNVKEWYLDGDEEDVPYTDVRDNEDITVENNGGFEWVMPLDILAVSGGDTSRTDARNMVGDIYKAIGTKQTLDNLVSLIDPVKHRILSEKGSALVSGVLVTIKVTFMTDTWSD